MVNSSLIDIFSTLEMGMSSKSMIDRDTAIKELVGRFFQTESEFGQKEGRLDATTHLVAATEYLRLKVGTEITRSILVEALAAVSRPRP